MNKKFKKLLAVAMTVAIGATFFVGCDSSSKDGGKVKLELFSTKPENKEILTSIIKDFEGKNPNIQITLSAPANPGTVLKTRLAKNTLPDLFATGGDTTFGSLIDGNALVDLTNDDLTKNIQKSYLDQLLGISANDGGKYYGVPYATNAEGVLYNKDIFTKLGISIPKTWDEFVADMDKIKASGTAPVYLTLKDNWTGMCLYNNVAADLQPTDFAKNRNAGKTTFAGTQAFSDVTDKMLTLAKYAQNDIMGSTYDDGNAALASGKTAMLFNGNWAIPNIKKDNANINLGLFPMPVTNDTTKNNVVSGVDVLFAVSAKSPHATEAKKFIAYMLEKDVAQRYMKDQAAFSAIKGITQEDSSVSDVSDAFKNGYIAAFPDHYYPQGLQTANYVQDFFNKKNKANFLKTLDTEYDKALATNK